MVTDIGSIVHSRWAGFLFGNPLGPDRRKSNKNCCLVVLLDPQRVMKKEPVWGVILRGEQEHMLVLALQAGTLVKAIPSRSRFSVSIYFTTKLHQNLKEHASLRSSMLRGMTEVVGECSRES